jgi:hypothetical protein
MATKKTPKKSMSKKVPTYKPTAVALVKDGKGVKVLVGSRRIEKFEKGGGEVLDRAAKYWSQLRYLRAAKTSAGKFVLTSARAAAARGLALVE